MKGRISREAENNFWSYMLSITYSITVLRTCATFFSAVAMTVGARGYAGVILGPCVKYDEKTDGVKFDPSVYDDHAGFQKRQNIVNHDLVKEKIIMNSINVLLTRPIRGLYIHIWDPILRQRFSRQWA